ncbi:MAG: replicative DNA helicase [Chloroflexi bacterium]|nr:MAG: replicative DNA helicase [Chloroflexota bacterium]
MTATTHTDLVGSAHPVGTLATSTPLRVPPHDLEAEQALLGGILIDKDAITLVRDVLTPEDFYAEKHAHLYRAATALADHGDPIDAVTLRDQLERGPGVGRAGGLDYVAELTLAVPSAASVKHYADIVVGHALRRRLINAGGEVARLGFDTAAGVQDCIDLAEQTVFRVGESHRSAEATHIAPIVQDTWALLETRLQQKRLVHGVPTNFAKLDALTQGLQPGELIILAARPSVGKTSFALNIARNAAVLARRPVAVFSLEMSKQALAQRLICSEAKVDNYLMRTGQLDSHAYQYIAKALDTLTQADLWIDDTPALAISALRARARRMKAQNGIELIVIDYLQLMQGGRQESRVQEVSDISSGLKAIAKELEIPVLALSQLSRESERRENKRPQLSDLRDSGCLVGSTPVFLPDEGCSRPIATLVGASGLRVLALDTETWKLVPRTAQRVFATGHRPVFDLTTQLGRKVRATANHEFLTLDGWKRLDELTIGDHLALPRSLPCPQTATMSGAELALLGHLIGDGCTLPRHAIQYTSADLALADLVSGLAGEVFGDAITARIRRERNWYQVYLSATSNLARGRRNPVAAWLADLGVFGLRSYEKRVPERAFNQPRAAIATFLRHLWSTDGCIYIGSGPGGIPRVYYATSSEQLARDVQSLLLRLDIRARARVAQQGTRGRPQHHISVSGQPDIRRFLSIIGPLRPSASSHVDQIQLVLDSRKANPNRDVIPSRAWQLFALPALAQAGMTRRRLAAELGIAYNGSALYRGNLSREHAARVGSVAGSPALLSLAASDVYWDPVASVQPAGHQDVFDLTVAGGPHNFVAGDVIVHNSIEQDADVVLFLYREGLHKQDVDKGKTELIVAKNRNGPTDEIPLVFIPTQTAFREPYLEAD